MSYVAPILIEQRFGNPFVMGLIMSTSSMCGLVFDLVAGRLFRQTSYRLFTKWLLLLALTFPLILLVLPHYFLVFFIAMAVWGVYYELTKFAQFNFIRVTMRRTEHTTSWALFEVMHAVGFVIGPVIASLLLEHSFEFALAAALVCFVLAVFGFKLYLAFARPRNRIAENPHTTETVASTAEPKYLHVWELLGSRLWPLLLFVFALVLIDTAFLSVGTLISEDLKQKNYLGLLLLPAYSVPFLIMPWFAQTLSSRFGKKRTAYLAGIIGGSLLAVGSLATQVAALLTLVFIASLCFALVYPEINATFEDYVVRVGKLGNVVIGLQSAMFSLAYIVGPPLAGLVATKWGNHYALTVFGLLLSVIGTLALIITPRKVRLPQHELHSNA
ncbi:MFS transporter [Candidatus Woesebacteria bacterium]|nr:MFS transporter [Candidatus Woesebacteria bacterium]